MVLVLAVILAKKDEVPDEIKLHISSMLLKRATIEVVQECFTDSQREYFIKCLVVSINNNDNHSIRQNITQLISNLLTPMWAKHPLNGMDVVLQNSNQSSIFSNHQFSSDKERTTMKLII